jgi:hypothetical protein
MKGIVYSADNYETSICFGGLHLMQWNYPSEGDLHSSAGWEVVGPCDGSCKREEEIPAFVIRMIHRFETTGKPQKRQTYPTRRSF